MPGKHVVEAIWSPAFECHLNLELLPWLFKINSPRGGSPLALDRPPTRASKAGLTGASYDLVIWLLLGDQASKDVLEAILNPYKKASRLIEDTSQQVPINMLTSSITRARYYFAGYSTHFPCQRHPQPHGASSTKVVVAIVSLFPLDLLNVSVDIF